MSNKWMELEQVEMEIAQQVGQASQMKESSQKAREPDKRGSQTARSQLGGWGSRRNLPVPRNFG